MATPSTPLVVPEPTRTAEIARLELARFAPEAPLDQVFARACEVSAHALRVERVGVWLFIDEGASLRCTNLFERSKAEHSAGAVLRVGDFPTYFRSLEIRKAVSVEVVATTTWAGELLATYLQPLGITSMLDAGIFVDGAMIGVVCHEHVGSAREWTTEERDFAGSVADLLALRIQSAEVRELRAAFLTQQERVAAQEKALALEQFAAGVAHDFRNLMMVFLGQGEVLSVRGDVSDDVRQQGREIFDAAERGIALAAELVEFARPHARPPAVIDLAAATAECLPMLQTAVGPKYSVSYFRPAALGHVLIDKTQFMRLLLNLVVNARDAMPDGGPIEISLTPIKLNDNPSYSGRFVLLEVTDRGIGMDEATQKRVFEPFFSTKSKGTGLGLAIVRQVVERAGGLIRIDSAHGRGTTFRLFFPRIGASNGGTTVFIIPPEMRGD